jgi:hypothetical protein
VKFDFLQQSFELQNLLDTHKSKGFRYSLTIPILLILFLISCMPSTTAKEIKTPFKVGDEWSIQTQKIPNHVNVAYQLKIQDVSQSGIYLSVNFIDVKTGAKHELGYWDDRRDAAIYFFWKEENQKYIFGCYIKDIKVENNSFTGVGYIGINYENSSITDYLTKPNSNVSGLCTVSKTRV